MTEFKFPDHALELLESLKSGRVLIGVSDGVEMNLMTVAWGFLGYTWNRPVFIAMIRPSRYTHDFFRRTDVFSVNFMSQEWQDALNFCGTRSGKYIDKFRETGLTPIEGVTTSVVVVKEADKVLECRVISREALTPFSLNESISSTFYGDHSYHSLIFGEITDSYLLP
jgi:flavin reductase (DIM6/NTAB) family NADH-FMN oxidoreductase RutF